MLPVQIPYTHSKPYKSQEKKKRQKRHVKNERSLVQFHQRSSDGNTPSPISIAPSEAFDGNDGPWSSFTLGFGSPAQFVRSLISTTSVQPWVVLPQGCVNQDPGPGGCPNSRGGLYNPNQSTTWQNQGLFALTFEENLGYNVNGDFGYETVALGLPESGVPILSHQIIAGFIATDFATALWGIRPASTNLTQDFSDPIPSILTNLKQQNLIPSLSWGYTAGAFYQNQNNKQGLGSLTLGGYDASLFEPNDEIFEFGPDNSRDILVGLQSISFTDSELSNQPLLEDPILAFIDSTIPHFWLPVSACEAFETAFGISWNSTLELYLVNDTIHESLVSKNASIEFQLTNNIVQSTNNSSSANVTITLPYGAFDLTLTANYPGIANDTRYFPLRRAANETQYTLGRTFLQQAYLTADYERNMFSVQQALFPSSPVPNIQAIHPPLTATTNTSSLPTGNHAVLNKDTISGIAATAVGILLIAIGTILVLRRRRRIRQEEEKLPLGQIDPVQKAELAAPDAGLCGFVSVELEASAVSMPELEGQEQEKAALRSGELHGSSVVHETVHEMP